MTMTCAIICSSMYYYILVLTFTIETSVEILDFYFDEHFGLRFKFGDNFGPRASRSSTASVFAFGLCRAPRLPCALRRVPSVLRKIGFDWCLSVCAIGEWGSERKRR